MCSSFSTHVYAWGVRGVRRCRDVAQACAIVQPAAAVSDVGAVWGKLRVVIVGACVHTAGFPACSL
jgi:hypothetical protein